MIRATLAVLASLCPVLAQAATPAPTPSPTPVVSWSTDQITGTLFKPGEDRRLFFGASARAAACAPFGLCAAVKLDGSSIGDGGAIEGGDPEAFTTAEGYVSVWKNVWGPIAPMAVGGITVPLDSAAETIESYPLTGMLGARIGDRAGDNYLGAGVGIHQAAGPGIKFLFSGAARVKGLTGVFVNGAIGGKGTFVRAGTTVRLKEN